MMSSSVLPFDVELASAMASSGRPVAARAPITAPTGPNALRICEPCWAKTVDARVPAASCTAMSWIWKAVFWMMKRLLFSAAPNRPVIAAAVCACPPAVR